MTSATDERRRAVSYLIAYREAAQKIARRFQDRKFIFPPHLFRPFVVDVVLCEDGVVLQYVHPRDDGHTDIRVSIESKSIAGPDGVVAARSSGMFLVQGPSARLGRPVFRMAGDGAKLRNQRLEFVLWCFEAWWSEDVEAWTEESARAEATALALGQLRSYASGHDLIGPPQPGVEDRLSDTIARYEALLASAGGEEELQVFLTENPILLCPSHLETVPKQQIGCGKEFEIDFVVKVSNNDNDYLVVEIEKPSTPIVNTSGPRDLSAPFTHALGQLRDFRDWINRHQSTAQTKMPGIRNPPGLLVAGMRRDLDERGLIRLAQVTEELRGKVEIATFDDLAWRGRALLRVLSGEAPPRK